MGVRAPSCRLKSMLPGLSPYFAMSLMMFPATIASRMPQTSKINILLNQYFNFGSFAYNLCYALLIIFFTYFYVAIIFNPMDVAENVKKYGGFVLVSSVDPPRNILTKYYRG